MSTATKIQMRINLAICDFRGSRPRAGSGGIIANASDSDLNDRGSMVSATHSRMSRMSHLLSKFELSFPIFATLCVCVCCCFSCFSVLVLHLKRSCSTLCGKERSGSFSGSLRMRSSMGMLSRDQSGFDLLHQLAANSDPVGTSWRLDAQPSPG